MMTRGLTSNKTWKVPKEARKFHQGNVRQLREDMGLGGLHRFEYRMLDHRFQATLDTREAGRMFEGSVHDSLLFSASKHIREAEGLANLMEPKSGTELRTLAATPSLPSNGVVFEAVGVAGA